MIAPLDGPAGEGKSSAGKALARRLGFDFLDAGAMYRAVTLAALRSGIDLQDQQALTRLLDDFRLEMPPGRVLLNGEDVTSVIRTMAVTNGSGAIANSRVVRRHLVGLQRAIPQSPNIACEGPDHGTIV